jgi:hypothetical protein
MTKPRSAPGLTLPEEGWIRNPKPGLYWLRYVNDDGTKTQPVFCVVTPTGPVETHAFWAWTPNLGIDTEDHESTTNYWVDTTQPIEYRPYTDDHLGCTFEIVAKPR